MGRAGGRGDGWSLFNGAFTPEASGCLVRVRSFMETNIHSFPLPENEVEKLTHLSETADLPEGPARQVSKVPWPALAFTAIAASLTLLLFFRGRS
jgi:hypothetical protein